MRSGILTQEFQSPAHEAFVIPFIISERKRTEKTLEGPEALVSSIADRATRGLEADAGGMSPGFNQTVAWLGYCNNDSSYEIISIRFVQNNYMSSSADASWV